jgi:hypothetical protein
MLSTAGQVVSIRDAGSDDGKNGFVRAHLDVDGGLASMDCAGGIRDEDAASWQLATI